MQSCDPQTKEQQQPSLPTHLLVNIWATSAGMITHQKEQCMQLLANVKTSSVEWWPRPSQPSFKSTTPQSIACFTIILICGMAHPDHVKWQPSRWHSTFEVCVCALAANHIEDRYYSTWNRAVELIEPCDRALWDQHTEIEVTCALIRLLSRTCDPWYIEHNLDYTEDAMFGLFGTHFSQSIDRHPCLLVKASSVSTTLHSALCHRLISQHDMIDSTTDRPR